MAPLPGIWMTLPIRNTLAALATLAMLCGCSSEHSDWGQVYRAARQTFSSDGPASVSLQQAAAVPYASMGVRIGDGAQVLIVQVIDSPDMRLWTAGKAIALETRDGRITRSSGLAFNLSGVAGTTVLAGKPAGDPGVRQTLLYDFADLNTYSVRVVCIAAAPVAAEITILGKAMAVKRIDENCSAGTFGWNFTNSYWVGESGLVWKSIQHIHPKLQAIETEILRPPASAVRNG